MTKPEMFRRTVLAAAMLLFSMTANGALAGEAAWADIKPAIFGDRAILPATPGMLAMTTPYRSEDDREVPVAVSASFVDGRTVRTVTVVIDENPMPVSAVFRFDAPRRSVSIATRMRFDGPSPIRTIVEASDGRLYMSESYVKTSGLGACASPPVNNPEDALARLGDMELVHGKAPSGNMSSATRTARLKIMHPNLTGLQMDQITLQHIPARYINTIEVREGDEPVLTVESGIALSENPEIEFDYPLNGAETLSVYAKDTDGTEFRHDFPVGTGS
ncbi:MAG TPA: quinoprotein dehydrogenase-associated SoxYZ-like carrier [Afifellaceae bacterium]|nr:quinoprotein dehydrogenase-associated SoxYZ-like carrier [Afifellaceae bacterium]